MKPEKINIAIVGFGNIGSYFYKVLEKNKKNILIKTGKIPFVKYISAKNIKKKRQTKIPRSKWIKNSISLASKNDIDVIVELIGGSEGAAKKLIFSALKNGKHVITANKALKDNYSHIIQISIVVYTIIIVLDNFNSLPFFSWCGEHEHVTI